MAKNYLSRITFRLGSSINQGKGEAEGRRLHSQSKPHHSFVSPSLESWRGQARRRSGEEKAESAAD